METFSKDIFVFGKARIVCGGKGAEVGVTGGRTRWYESGGHRKLLLV